MVEIILSGTLRNKMKRKKPKYFTTKNYGLFKRLRFAWYCLTGEIIDLETIEKVVELKIPRVIITGLKEE